MRIRSGLWTACLLLASCGGVSPHADLSPQATLKAAGAEGPTFGSTFAPDPDHLITAAHVVRHVEDGATVQVRYRDEVTSATLIARSAHFDLAVLRRAPSAMPAIAIDVLPALGQLVTAHGTTVNLGEAVARRASGTVTLDCVELGGFGAGVVALLSEATPGFSGGPVVDRNGRLVGMLIALDRSGGRDDAFAPVNSRPRQFSATRAFLLPSATIRRELDLLLGRRYPLATPALCERASRDAAGFIGAASRDPPEEVTTGLAHIGDQAALSNMK